MSFKVWVSPKEIWLPVWIAVDPQREYLGCPHGVPVETTGEIHRTLFIFNEEDEADDYIKDRRLESKLAAKMVVSLEDLAALLESCHRAGVAFLKIRIKEQEVFTDFDADYIPTPLLLYLGQVRRQQQIP